jgi:hypothetical protein
VGPVVGLVPHRYGAANFPRVFGRAFGAKAGGNSAADKDVVGGCPRARRCCGRRAWLQPRVQGCVINVRIVVVHCKGAVVGAPSTAKSLPSSGGASNKFLAAFPGVAFLTLHGIDVIVDIPSSKNLSSSSEGITSGPFAPVAAFAVARRGGFIRRLAPSRFAETQGICPPADFCHFAAPGPASAAGLPYALAPAVLPAPVLRVGPNFRAIVGAIL